MSGPPQTGDIKTVTLAEERMQLLLDMISDLNVMLGTQGHMLLGKVTGCCCTCVRETGMQITTVEKREGEGRETRKQPASVVPCRLFSLAFLSSINSLSFCWGCQSRPAKSKSLCPFLPTLSLTRAAPLLLPLSALARPLRFLLCFFPLPPFPPSPHLSRSLASEVDRNGAGLGQDRRRKKHA